MSELVRQSAHREDVVVVAHEDEGLGVHRPARESAHPLALVGIDVDPAVLECAFAHDRDVFLAEWRHALRDPVHRFFVGHPKGAGAELRAQVVRLQHLEAQHPPADAPVAVPRADVLAEGLDDVVEHVDRNEPRLERGLERGRVPARPREEHVAFDRAGQARRHRVLHPQVLIGVALKGGAPDLAVCTGEERSDGALSDLMQLAARSNRGRELEVGVGEHAVH